MKNLYKCLVLIAFCFSFANTSFANTGLYTDVPSGPGQINRCYTLEHGEYDCSLPTPRAAITTSAVQSTVSAKDKELEQKIDEINKKVQELQRNKSSVTASSQTGVVSMSDEMVSKSEVYNEFNSFYNYFNQEVNNLSDMLLLMVVVNIALLALFLINKTKKTK